MFRFLLIAALFSLLLLLGGQEQIVLGKLGFISSLFAKEEDVELRALRSENSALRAALELRETCAAAVPDRSRGGLVAGVFSAYPFNFRPVLTLSRGANAGVQEGAVVVLGGALVGQVTKVSAEISVAKTVFDPRWEIPVRIGASGVDAVLVGGTVPRLTFIAKDAAVGAGDTLTAADPSLPFGLAIGEIEEVTSEPSTPFKEAKLRLPYRISALRFVSLLEPVAR